jgi:hypothetical protein
VYGERMGDPLTVASEPANLFPGDRWARVGADAFELAALAAAFWAAAPSWPYWQAQYAEAAVVDAVSDGDLGGALAVMRANGIYTIFAKGIGGSPGAGGPPSYTQPITITSRAGPATRAGDGSGNITVTVPKFVNAPFPPGSTIILRAMGAGQVNVIGDTGVTVNSPNGLATRAQYSTIAVIASSVAQDVWVASGDLTP